MTSKLLCGRRFDGRSVAMRTLAADRERRLGHPAPNYKTGDGHQEDHERNARHTFGPLIRRPLCVATTSARLNAGRRFIANRSANPLAVRWHTPIRALKQSVELR